MPKLTLTYLRGATLGALAALFLVACSTDRSGLHDLQALDGGRPLSAILTGEAEVPGPGDPDGSGTAQITLNQGLGEVCFTITVTDITLPASAAHIHVGTADVAGPVVVGLAPPDASGSSSGCTSDVDAELIKAIRQNPSAYYVNVHTSDFPAGAVRGQLTK